MCMHFEKGVVVLNLVLMSRRSQVKQFKAFILLAMRLLLIRSTAQRSGIFVII